MPATGPTDALLAALPLAFAVAAAVVVALALWYSLFARDPAARRLAALGERHRVEPRGALFALRRRGAGIHGLKFMRGIVDRLTLLRSRRADAARKRLVRAGWRSPDALVVYFFFRLALPLLFGGGTVLAVYGFDLYELSAGARALATLCALALGGVATDLVVTNRIQKRQQRLERSLPDALDLLVVCAEAGLSLDVALDWAAREINAYHPDLATELRLTSIELGLLSDRRTAFENLGWRTGVPRVRSLVNTLLQTEKYGTPLSHSLRVLAAESRAERLLRAEAKAARLAATLTVPLIVFILPSLFVVLLGPAIVRVLDTIQRF